MSSNFVKGINGINTGPWSDNEHHVFIQLNKLYGRDWIKISSLIDSRTLIQVREYGRINTRNGTISRNHLNGEITGVWTDKEKRLFNQGVSQYGFDCSLLVLVVTTQSIKSIRDHGYKLFGMPVSMPRQGKKGIISNEKRYKVKRDAKEFATKYINSRQDLFKGKGDDDYALRYCYAVMNKDGIIANNEDSDPFTLHERQLPFCNSDGHIYRHGEIKRLLEIEIVHKGAICGEVDKSQLQFDTYLINEIEVKVLRHLHNNKQLQFPLKGPHECKSTPNTNKKLMS